jgi:predicted O-methyltransferase YrrM
MLGAVPRPLRRSTTSVQDLSEAERAWGRADARGLVGLGDLPKAARRLSLTLHLAGAALRDPRAFRTTAVAIRRHRALQKPLELFHYLRFLQPRGIARCLEIGTLWGGTFFAHCAVTAPRGHVIAVDAFPRESADVMTARFRSLARPAQRVTCLWRDSHAGETAAEIAAALDGALLDLLFLDGDHSLEGASLDYELYAPMVRPGGVIALHDIAAPRADGIPALWRSLRRRHESVEFIDHRHAPPGLGIGAMVKG